MLQQTATELETLAAQRQEKQQELESLERDMTSGVEQARDAVVAASAAVDSAELKTKEMTTQVEEAQGSLNSGEVSTRQESVDREDLPAAVSALGELQSKLEALPTLETEATDARRTEAGGLVRKAQEQRDEHQSELQKAGRSAATSWRPLHPGEARPSRRGGTGHRPPRTRGRPRLWRLAASCDTLQEAEAEDAVHLGKALIEPITKRMSELTGGRYRDLVIGPKLETESIELGGTQRELTSLSMGTQEQLATVLRLTIADKVGSTVVLDDQLVQSDASRMDWLRAFMVECAEKFQILVFTCRPEEYDAAGAVEGPSFKSLDLADYVSRSP